MLRDVGSNEWMCLAGNAFNNKYVWMTIGRVYTHPLPNTLILLSTYLLQSFIFSAWLSQSEISGGAICIHALCGLLCRPLWELKWGIKCVLSLLLSGSNLTDKCILCMCLYNKYYVYVYAHTYFFIHIYDTQITWTYTGRYNESANGHHWYLNMMLLF